MKCKLLKGSGFVIMSFIVLISVSCSAQSNQMFESYEALSYGLTAVGPDSVVPKDDYKELLDHLKDRQVAESHRFKQKLKSSGEEVTLTSEDVMILHFATLDEQMKESLLTELGEHKTFQFEYSGEGSFSITQVFKSEIDSESDLED